VSVGCPWRRRGMVAASVGAGGATSRSAAYAETGKMGGGAQLATESNFQTLLQPSVVQP
jgi:hypothetical protein